MANFFEQLHQLKQARDSAKAMQRQLASTKVEYENAGVRVETNGDLSEVSVKFLDPTALDPARVDKLERTVSENVAKAMCKAKAVQEELGKAALKQMGVGGLGSMFGG